MTNETTSNIIKVMVTFTLCATFIGVLVLAYIGRIDAAPVVQGVLTLFTGVVTGASVTALQVFTANKAQAAVLGLTGPMPK